MIEISYRALVWLTYRLAATFTLGLPFILLLWAVIKKESSLIRLLSIYWKISSILVITMLLLIDEKPLGYLVNFLSPILIVSSVWFWVDLNEEIADLPPWRPLALTIRVWRWSLTFLGVLYAGISFISLNCMQNLEGALCLSWLEAPQTFHNINQKIFGFLFGGNWNEPLASFLGYIALIIYFIGVIQWLLIRMPKQGRIAGEF